MGKYSIPFKQTDFKDKVWKNGLASALEVNAILEKNLDLNIANDLKKFGHKIFGMYKTFNNIENSKGLGLFIIKNQIEAIGGKIEVESQLNIGSAFSVYFNL